MAYFKINDVDFSRFVNALKVSSVANYTAQTNAAGSSVVDYINEKRVIEVGFRPMTGAEALEIRQAIAPFYVSIAFFNPDTNALSENISCIVPNKEIDYYLIRSTKQRVNGFSLTFEEL